jgi:imidazolonepropionase-like amidohydrolase
VFNAFNSDVVLNSNNTFGAAWLTPTSVQQARQMQGSVRFDFYSDWAGASMNRLTASSWRILAFLIVAALSTHLTGQAQPTRVTVFEGARLIAGDGTPPIESSAFVVENDRFTRVGPRGQVQVPAGAARVDLTGKTVMPAKVDLHGHIGFQHDWDGTMAKEYFTRENLIDHLQRLAYFGISATVSIGDLVDRSDLRGGRTGWGDVPLRVRNEVVPGAALFRTAGPGIAWPGSGAQGHPSRSDVPYPVTTVEQAREATRDYVRMKPEFIKIWVDDRNGRTQKLTPPLYLAIIEEAHKAGVPVAAHSVTLADAKILLKAGVEGWLHPPVRGGEAPDEELLAMIRERIARKNRPNMWFNGMAGTAGSSREDWDDPLLRETISPQQIQAQVGEQLAKMTPDTVARARANLRTNGVSSIQKLRAAGMKLVLGGDTGQTRFFIGWSQQLEFENWIHMGLTPMEAIVAATRDSAAAARLNTGLVAPGRDADFVVLDANPLDDIKHSRRINRVYLRGQEVDRAGLRAKWQARWKKSTE